MMWTIDAIREADSRAVAGRGRDYQGDEIPIFPDRRRRAAGLRPLFRRSEINRVEVSGS